MTQGLQLTGPPGRRAAKAHRATEGSSSASCPRQAAGGGAGKNRSRHAGAPEFFDKLDPKVFAKP